MGGHFERDSTTSEMNLSVLRRELNSSRRVNQPQVGLGQRSHLLLKPGLTHGSDLISPCFARSSIQSDDCFAWVDAIRSAGDEHNLQTVRHPVVRIVVHDHGGPDLLDFAPIDGSKATHQTSPRNMVTAR